MTFTGLRCGSENFKVRFFTHIILEEARMKNILRAMFLITLFAGVVSAQTREQTTIQTTAIDLGSVKGAVAFSYLNLPWGEKTFSYIEHGVKDSYYGERTWPFAQMDTKVSLTVDGTKLAPGQYALVITPGSDAKSMTFSVVRFEGPTFLKPGNVFSPTPKGASLVSKDAEFATVEALTDHMNIETQKTKDGFTMIVNYGNRKFTKAFSGK